MAPDDVLADALVLPAEERARIARELIASLDEPADTSASDAWLTEVGRRLSEIEMGTAALEDWTSVRVRIAARLKSI